MAHLIDHHQQRASPPPAIGGRRKVVPSKPPSQPQLPNQPAAVASNPNPVPQSQSQSQPASVSSCFSCLLSLLLLFSVAYPAFLACSPLAPLVPHKRNPPRPPLNTSRPTTVQICTMDLKTSQNSHADSSLPSSHVLPSHPANLPLDHPLPRLPVLLLPTLLPTPYIALACPRPSFSLPCSSCHVSKNASPPPEAPLATAFSSPLS